MDAHRLAEERSLAYHAAVAARLGTEPMLLERARMRVRAWLVGEPVPHFARGWAAVLAGTPATIGAVLRDRGERATELRQSTPFAGAIPPRERWRIWRAVRERGGIG